MVPDDYVFEKAEGEGIRFFLINYKKEDKEMEKNIQTKKISLSNTKQEMLAAYNALLKQLQEKEEVELKPEGHDTGSHLKY